MTITEIVLGFGFVIILIFFAFSLNIKTNGEGIKLVLGYGLRKYIIKWDDIQNYNGYGSILFLNFYDRASNKYLSYSIGGIDKKFLKELDQHIMLRSNNFQK
jgi:hypothetical protein